MGHWDAVLAELVEERKKLDALIALATERAGKSGGADLEGGSIRSDTFFAMKAPEAIKRFLSLAKAPKSPKDIADGLEAGGYQSTSKDLANTLRTALRRMADDDEVVQVSNGDWGLAEWYPGRQRRRVRGNGELDDGTALPDSTDSTEMPRPS